MLHCFTSEIETEILINTNNIHLSKLQSLTDPSTAQEAILTSDSSRVSVAWGWKLIAPTLVLWPEKEEFTFNESRGKSCKQEKIKNQLQD